MQKQHVEIYRNKNRGFSGEYVMIGEDIMVKVIKSDFGDLRLAIDAPKTTINTRGELYENKINSLMINK